MLQRNAFLRQTPKRATADAEQEIGSEEIKSASCVNDPVAIPTSRDPHPTSPKGRGENGSRFRLYRALRGLNYLLGGLIPGAYAPGFMLTCGLRTNPVAIAPGTDSVASASTR
jgi:hypothetical protein